MLNSFKRRRPVERIVLKAGADGRGIVIVNTTLTYAHAGYKVLPSGSIKFTIVVAPLSHASKPPTG